MSETTLSEQLRAAVDAAPDGITLDDVVKKCGGEDRRATITTLLGQLARKDQLRRTGKRADRLYFPNPSGHMPKAGKAQAGAGKKRKGSAHDARRLREIRENMAKASADGGRKAHFKHVSTTLAALEAVIDLESSDAMVATAFQAHKEAIALLGG